MTKILTILLTCLAAIAVARSDAPDIVSEAAHQAYQRLHAPTYMVMATQPGPPGMVLVAGPYRLETCRKRLPDALRAIAALIPPTWALSQVACEPISSLGILASLSAGGDCVVEPGQPLGHEDGEAQTLWMYACTPTPPVE